MDCGRFALSGVQDRDLLWKRLNNRPTFKSSMAQRLCTQYIFLISWLSLLLSFLFYDILPGIIIRWQGEQFLFFTFRIMWRKITNQMFRQLFPTYFLVLVLLGRFMDFSLLCIQITPNNYITILHQTTTSQLHHCNLVLKVAMFLKKFEL